MVSIQKAGDKPFGRWGCGVGVGKGVGGGYGRGLVRVAVFGVAVA